MKLLKSLDGRLILSDTETGDVADLGPGSDPLVSADGTRFCCTTRGGLAVASLSDPTAIESLSPKVSARPICAGVHGGFVVSLDGGEVREVATSDRTSRPVGLPLGLRPLDVSLERGAYLCRTRRGSLVWAAVSPPSLTSEEFGSSDVVAAAVVGDGLVSLSRRGQSHILTVSDSLMSEERSGIDATHLVARYGSPVSVRPLVDLRDEGTIALLTSRGMIILSRDLRFVDFVDGVTGVDAGVADGNPRRIAAAATATTRDEVRMGIVLTCHDAYLKWLPRCIDSIDRQDFFASKVLVLDGCELPPGYLPTGWQVMIGKWGSPNPARNLGMRTTDTEWTMFFDADNVMAPGYAAALAAAASVASPDVGVLYTDLLFCGEAMDVRAKFEGFEWGRWNLDRKNFIDTSALWRTRALEMVGGWNEQIPTEDDYWLALGLARRGWLGQRVEGVATLHSDHFDDPGRWQTAREAGREADALWQIRSMCFLTLFSGRPELLAAWRDFATHAKLPPRTNLLMVDNSGDAGFHASLARVASELMMDGRFQSVTLRHMDERCPSPLDGTASYYDWLKHLHVARMYGEILPTIDDDFIFTLEDDVIPRDLRAVWKLHDVFVEDFCGDARVGVACAAYAAPVDPGFVTASFAAEEWGDGKVRWSDLQAGPMDVGFVGGGCTIWANWALKRVLPITPEVVGSSVRGWDNYLCRSLRREGFRVVLHGGLSCDHMCRRWKEGTGGESSTSSPRFGTIGRLFRSMRMK